MVSRKTGKATIVRTNHNLQSLCLPADSAQLPTHSDKYNIHCAWFSIYLPLYLSLQKVTYHLTGTGNLNHMMWALSSLVGNKGRRKEADIFCLYYSQYLQGSHRDWKTWKMKMVMEKSWNMKDLPKVTEFCDQSWNLTNFTPPNCAKFVFFLVTTKKLSSDLDSPHFPMFSVKRRKCKIGKKDGQGKVMEKYFVKSVGTLTFVKRFGFQHWSCVVQGYVGRQSSSHGRLTGTTTFVGKCFHWAISPFGG